MLRRQGASLADALFCFKFQDTYVINGFYMSMREKYVAKGASIYYFTVEWDEKDLSWEDFRG